MNDKKNKKKITVIFLLLVFGGGVIGVSLALGIFFAKDVIMQWIPSLYIILQKASPWIFMVICLIALLLPYISLIHAKKLIKNRSEPEEKNNDDFYEETDRLLNHAVGISLLGMNVIFILFPLVTIATLKGNCGIVHFFLCALFFLFFAIFASFLQRESIEQIRILNPEKKGDALELHFKRKWLESLDEQEKYSAYAASYKAFSSLHILFYSFFILLVLFIPFFDVSFLPFLCIGCMWLIPNAIYLREASKKHIK